MSTSKSTPQNTIIDAKQAIFDKIFKENQDLRDQNKELKRILNNFDCLAKEREAQHRHFENLEERILKADNLYSLATEVQKLLATDFSIPIANIALIDSVKKSSGFIFQNFLEPVSSESKRELSVSITEICEADYNRMFPKHTPLITRNPAPALIELFKSGADNVAEIASAAFIPLLSRSRIVGLLNLASPDPDKFIPGTATDAVEGLGRKLATVIENNLLAAQLQQLLRTDPLTKLYNRRVFDEILPIEFARASRYQHPLSIIMIDLDDFKQINDTYGHAAGDKVLQMVGELINNNLRQHDIGLRYGGDEFTIILPGTDYQQAQSVIDKITRQTNDCKISINQKTDIKIKISAGLATYTEDKMDSAQSLQEAADKNLYEIKRRKKEKN